LFAGIAGHTMLVRREFLQREEIWVDKFFYDWSIAVSAYLYDHRGIVKIDEPLNWHRSHENEAALKQNLDLFLQSKKKPTYQPYLYGFRRMT
jgi:hypothetical protein